MNLDFLAMNLTGFSFYSIYCSYGYFYPGGTAETGQVDLNDLIFAYHALLITILTVAQAFYFPKGKNKIMKITIIYLVIMWLFCIIYGTITLVFFIVNIGSKCFPAVAKARCDQLYGLLQAVDLIPQISASDVLELQT
jgi:hypothetical protein